MVLATFKIMEATKRTYKTKKYFGFDKSITKCPFHKYIKIGSGSCSKCYCNEGTTKDFVKCSYPE